MFQSFTRGVTKTLEAALVINLAIMAVLVFGNVVLRYGFESGIAVSEELSRLLFVWLIFIGAVHASRQHAHIGFDSLIGRLPARWKKVVIVVTGALMLVAATLFIVGGWQQTRINLDNSYPVLGISYAWLYGVAIVFGAGLVISIVLNVRDALSQADGEKGPQP